jgi:hypothetical protein
VVIFRFEAIAWKRPGVAVQEFPDSIPAARFVEWRFRLGRVPHLFLAVPENGGG